MSTDDSDQLPYATAKSLTLLGKIRERYEDFQVEELPAYTPSGIGEHLMLRFEKTGMTTPEAVRRLARGLGVDPIHAGWAGLKDRNAVTTQWVTLHGATPEAARTLEIPGIRVLEAARHAHKLRTGHLKGNRFTIRIRGDAGQRPTATAVMAELATSGCPNYYGEQRFGHGGHNPELARSWLLRGARPPRDRFARKLLASALQASWFNTWLAERIRRAEFQRALDGDVLRKEDSGGLFVTDDLTDAQARVASFAVSPTGPMFGMEMRWPEREALRFERALFEREGLSDEILARHRKFMPGARRVARVRPSEVRVETFESGIELAFTLPKGAYATVILRELLKPPAAEAGMLDPDTEHENEGD